MDNSKRLTEALQFAESFAVSSRVEFLTPELLLVGICCRNNEFMALCESYHVDYQKNLKEPIYGDLHNNFVPDTVGEYEILPSVQYHLNSKVHTKRLVSNLVSRKAVHYKASAQR